MGVGGICGEGPARVNTGKGKQKMKKIKSVLLTLVFLVVGMGVNGCAPMYVSSPKPITKKMKYWRPYTEKNLSVIKAKEGFLIIDGRVVNPTNKARKVNIRCDFYHGDSDTLVATEEWHDTGATVVKRGVNVPAKTYRVFSTVYSQLVFSRTPITIKCVGVWPATRLPKFQ